MKNTIIKNSLLVLSILFIISCKKEPKTVVDPIPVAEPEPDPYTYNNELQSSKDISFVTYAISDIDMICAYASQGIHGDYGGIPSEPSSTVTIIRDTTNDINQITYTFNNVNCIDGRFRSGTVFMYYAYHAINNPWAEHNARNYESYGFSASVYLDDFKVDGWKIQLYDPTKPAHVRNTLESDLYSPALTNLTWEISGKFQFIHPTDPARNIVWDGTIKKTLKNTSNTAVFADKNAMVNWNLAQLEYSGSFSGTRYSSLTPYTYKIDLSTPLYRDMTCSYAPQGASEQTNFHPFAQGKSLFTISDYHPRTIDYGPNTDCDNSGTVSFKGESYNIDFE